MANKKLQKDEKVAELTKYRDLLIATLDWYLAKKELKFTTAEFDSDKHYESLKIQTEEHFKKGRLTMLKNWFRDMTEMQLETGDLKFNTYLKNTTGYDIDIFKSYFKRIDNIISKGKITTDRQFYEVNEMVGQLCQAEPLDTDKINTLNKLLSDYETPKKKK